ncbi:hypothetical protein [Flavonifractor sp. An306]|uniref:hypothetical protein n=1 Tax=Flavonifractor sp. An306 TaxID=1965629 RepID=UPI00174B8AE5|nr:hypothetical protein [Flavonifractor sp. An306]
MHVITQPDSPGGWTDGKDIYINTINSVSGHYTRVVEQFIALRGVCFHECAHALYLDFAEEKKAINSLNRGKLYGPVPAPSNSDEAEMIQEMQNALENPLYRPIFQQVYNDVANCTDDPHDEGKIMQACGRMVEQGIVFCRESILRKFDMAENIVAGDSSDLSKLYWLMLEYARFETILVKDDSFFQSDPLMRCIVSMAKPIATARWTDDLKIRFGAINQMLLALWPYIKKELDKLDDLQKGGSDQSGDEGQTGDNSPSDNNNQGGDGGQPGQNQPGQGQPQQNQPGDSGQSGGQGAQAQQTGQSQSGGSGVTQNQSGAGQTPHSKRAIQQVLEQLQKASKNASQSVAPQPQNGKTSDIAAANRKAARKGKQGEDKTQGSDDIMTDLSAAQSAFEKICAEIAERRALDIAERDLASDLMMEIDKLGKRIDSPCTLVSQRSLAIDDSDIQLYNEQMKEVADFSKRLKRRMDEALRDMRDGGVKHHRQMGRIIEAQYAYRPDQRYFASKKMPQDWPTMAISVLVDLSGSMRGERLNAAMKAAMLLYDFATGLGIPVFVAGHNAVGSHINYNVMAEFDGVDERDRYRLAHMYLAGDNYDGVAIEVSAGLLAKRKEEVKLLFIISDGQPNHGSYCGEAAKKDIQEVVSKYRRKGVITFATAIGTDRDKIREIYGDGYLDISDLSVFPKQLARMVAKRLIQM